MLNTLQYVLADMLEQERAIQQAALNHQALKIKLPNAVWHIVDGDHDIFLANRPNGVLVRRASTVEVPSTVVAAGADIEHRAIGASVRVNIANILPWMLGVSDS